MQGCSGGVVVDKGQSLGLEESLVKAPSRE